MKQPFFIVGMMRSGTTYLYRLLEKHPKIAMTDEARVADYLAFAARGASVPSLDVEELHYLWPVKLRGMVEPEHIELFGPIMLRHAIAALEEFYTAKFAHKDFTHWGEKLPAPRTALELQTTYPHARFIILLRDPRDSWCSFVRFRARWRVQPELAELTPGQWGQYWAITYRHLLRYLRHQHVMRYEDFVLAPRAGLEAVLTFLGLSGADELIRDFDHAKSFERHGSSRSPETSIGRWRHELDPETARAIEEGAAELMAEYGYGA